MHLRHWFFACALALASLWNCQPLRAQCLALEMLDQAVAQGRITPDSVDLLLEAGEWQLHKGPNPYWTHRTLGEADTPEAKAQAWVGLRRSNQQAHYDLVYKTQQYACITRLRAQLRRRAKLKSELVNCVQCEGERLIGNGYSVTIFNQKDNYLAKHTTYPYVLVIRRTTNDAAATPASPEHTVQVAEEN